jgi:hypothetical protein
MDVAAYDRIADISSSVRAEQGLSSSGGACRRPVSNCLVPAFDMVHHPHRSGRTRYGTDFTRVIACDYTPARQRQSLERYTRSARTSCRGYDVSGAVKRA